MILTTAGLSLCLGTNAALAEDRAQPLGSELPRHQIDAGVFLGGNFFSNQLELGNAYHDDQVPTSAFLLGLRGSYLLIPHLVPGLALDPSLSVEVEAKLAFASTAGSAEFMRDSYSAPVLGWRAQAVLSIWPDRPLRPFVLLGIGGETAFSSSPFVDSVDSDAALSWGFGARYQITPAYGIRGDIRHGITAARSSLAANNLELHVGFVYRFGIGKRSSPDIAATKGEREDVREDDTQVAMPTSKDTDGDGFSDEVDQCPEQAETVNEIDDADGCPEADQDGDELLDMVDQCPEQAEDMDGWMDEDGCPENDNDQDGRPDAIDGCPQEPEVLNGFEDDDGCADEVPQEVRDGLASIRFVPNSVQLTAAKPHLVKLVDLLNKHPSVRLLIAGHTDNSEKKANALSLQRADAVKAFLVGQGIDPGRLETVGHGADKPEANNRTKLGKARNRRVDFDLMPGPATLPDPTAEPVQPGAPDGASEPAADAPSTPEGPAPGSETSPTPEATPNGDPAPAPATAPAQE